MTVANLKNIVLNDTDDTVDDSVLLGWLNRGREYVEQFVILPENETTATLTFTDGLADLPDDFLHFVELQIGEDFFRNEVDFENRNSAPDGSFYFWGSKLGIVPAETTTGTLAYVAMSAAFSSDSDTPKMPAVFQPLIAEYAKGLYREANGNYAKAVAHYTNVDNAIERLTGKLRRRTRRKSTAWGDIRDQYPNYP